MKKIETILFSTLAAACVATTFAMFVNVADAATTHMADTIEVTTDTTKFATIDDHDSTMVAKCEALLDACEACGLMDEAGKECYKQLKTKKSVAAYVELAQECAAEDNFYDTVGAGSEWDEFEWYVLEPMNMAE